mmetsp:Transcript_15186/g.42522  ORF Transcript_15186/g.42522 Transcript_15186/m.42522 type:complete len:231 (-) Transcript_15186:24-716(-)
MACSDLGSARLRRVMAICALQSMSATLSTFSPKDSTTASSQRSEVSQYMLSLEPSCNSLSESRDETHSRRKGGSLIGSKLAWLVAQQLSSMKRDSIVRSKASPLSRMVPDVSTPELGRAPPERFLPGKLSSSNLIVRMEYYRVMMGIDVSDLHQCLAAPGLARKSVADRISGDRRTPWVTVSAVGFVRLETIDHLEAMYCKPKELQVGFRYHPVSGISTLVCPGSGSHVM